MIYKKRALKKKLLACKIQYLNLEATQGRRYILFRVHISLDWYHIQFISLRATMKCMQRVW